MVNDLPDGTRESIARLRLNALNSTYFMGFILGFRDLTPGLHGEMARWIQGPRRRKLGLVPRDHLKTSVWTMADSMRLISKNPLERILIVNEIAANATDFLRQIKNFAERCTLWQALFPERIPDFNGRWNEEALCFPRPEHFVEPTVAAIGVGGASTSKHYTHIKEDDLVGKEAAESQALMKRAIDQHKLAEHLLVDPSLDTIDTYGTRWGNSDLYDWMMKNEDPDSLSTFHTGCYDPQGQPIWPQRFSAEELERIRRKNGARLFSFQMLNMPIAEGATDFDTRWLCYYTVDTNREGEPVLLLEKDGQVRRVPLADCKRFQAVDPNLTKDARRGGRSAVVTAALTPSTYPDPYDIVILGARAKSVAPENFMRLVRDEYALWDPEVTGIEVFAAQKVFYEWLQRDFPSMRVTALRTDTHTSKLSRIRSTSPFFEQRRVYVHRSQTDFLEEYAAFPTGQTVDLLDAFAYLPQLWFSPDPAEEAQDEAMEEFERHAGGRNEWTGY